MGTYYNPPEKLPEVARELNDFAYLSTQNRYIHLTEQLTPDEVLFGLYDRGPFMNAVHMPDINEFRAFEEQVDAAIITVEGYYAMSSESFENYFGHAPTRQQYVIFDKIATK